MLLNHLVHAVFGFIARNNLTWTTSGIIICLIFTGVAQALDLKRMNSSIRNRLIETHPKAIHNGRLEAYDRDAPYKLAQLWIIKVIWYGSVTMVVALLTR